MGRLGTGNPARTGRRIAGYFTDAQMARIREVGDRRETSESNTLRFLVGKGLEWWDTVTDREREIA